MQYDVHLTSSSDLPVHEATASSAPCLQPDAGTPPVRILVIDDEPGLRRALAGLLKRQGYTVTTVDHGASAWKLLHTQSYDVILCDLLMPELDGQVFYRLLEQYYPSQCSRVIFLTGDTLGETTDTFLQHIGQPWLYKPCGAAEVLQAIAQVLRVAESSHIV